MPDSPGELLLDADRMACQNLVRLLQDGHGGPPVVAFLGAGLSLPLGYPSWRKLVEALAYLANGKVGRSIARADGRKLIDTAEVLRRRLVDGGREDEYYRFLETQFPVAPRFPHGALSYREIHRDILATNFSSFLITNYDCCLEHAAASDQSRHYVSSLVCSAGELDPSLLAQSGRRAYYLHGRICDTYGSQQPRKLIVTRSDYDAAYAAGTGPVRNFLSAVFMQCTVLFIGYSLNDPDVIRILDSFREWAEEENIRDRHYALCPYAQPGSPPSDLGGPDDWEFVRRHSVVPLRYPVNGADLGHEVLSRFCARLAAVAGWAARGLGGGSPTP